MMIELLSSRPTIAISIRPIPAELRAPWSFFGEAWVADARSVFQCEIHPSTEINPSPAPPTEFGLCFAHLDS